MPLTTRWPFWVVGPAMAIGTAVLLWAVLPILGSRGMSVALWDTFGLATAAVMMWDLKHQARRVFGADLSGPQRVLVGSVVRGRTGSDKPWVPPAALGLARYWTGPQTRPFPYNMILGSILLATTGHTLVDPTAWWKPVLILAAAFPVIVWWRRWRQAARAFLATG